MKKQCFVVGPIGDDDSDDRIHADWLLEDIIIPVFDKRFPDFEVQRADTLANPGQITTQVINALLDAELVIADLTTLNPNAFYEIGIRHTVQKPIIHMHLEGQRIPFDIAPFRSIKFSRKRPRDIKAARTVLQSFVEEALSDHHVVDNPVTFSRGKLEFDKSATPAEKLMQDQIMAMQDRMSMLEGMVQEGTITASTRAPVGGVFPSRQYATAHKDVVAIRTTGTTSTRQLGKIIIDVVPKYFRQIDIISENEYEVFFAVERSPKNRKNSEVMYEDIKQSYPDVKVETTWSKQV